MSTQDWQTGVVSAQRLLATVPSGTGGVTVTIPPNAETLVVFANISGGLSSLRAIGQTSFYQYPATTIQTAGAGGPYLTAFIDCSNAVDAQMDVILAPVPAHAWYIYSDAAVHFFVSPPLQNAGGINGAVHPGGAIMMGLDDGSNIRTAKGSQLGNQYVIPVPPDTFTGDHPPTELTVVSAQPAASGAVLPAAGLGVRYRLFSCELLPLAAGMSGWLADSISAAAFCAGTSAERGDVTFYPAGYPLSANAALNFVLNAGAGATFVSARYTTETV